MAKKRRRTSGGYSCVQDGDGFRISCGGEPMATPMGNPLRTSFRDLAEEMVADLERQGPDPEAGLSMYVCLCSLLDFGPLAGKFGLITNALSGLRDDRVLNMSADPEIMFTQMAAFAQPYFVESGIREKTLDDLLKWVGVEMATWSMQELMVVQLASAHFMSPLIGMALAQDKVDIAAAAVGCCGRFWQHKMNSLGGISFGDSNGYFPPRVDDRFCQNACLRNQGGDEDEPERERAASEFPSKCGVGIVMDVMRRFATYGRNLRTGNAQLSH